MVPTLNQSTRSLTFVLVLVSRFRPFSTSHTPHEDLELFTTPPTKDGHQCQLGLLNIMDVTLPKSRHHYCPSLAQLHLELYFESSLRRCADFQVHILLESNQGFPKYQEVFIDSLAENATFQCVKNNNYFIQFAAQNCELTKTWRFPLYFNLSTDHHQNLSAWNMKMELQSFSNSVSVSAAHDDETLTYSEHELYLTNLETQRTTLWNFTLNLGNATVFQVDLEAGNYTCEVKLLDCRCNFPEVAHHCIRECPNFEIVGAVKSVSLVQLSTTDWLIACVIIVVVFAAVVVSGVGILIAFKRPRVFSRRISVFQPKTVVPRNQIDKLAVLLIYDTQDVQVCQHITTFRSKLNELGVTQIYDHGCDEQREAVDTEGIDWFTSRITNSTRIVIIESAGLIECSKRNARVSHRSNILHWILEQTRSMAISHRSERYSRIIVATLGENDSTGQLDVGVHFTRFSLIHDLDLIVAEVIGS